MEEPLDPYLFGQQQPCFGCAPSHPIGFRLRFFKDGDEVITRFVPDERYQGPPGLMHGGLVTTLADEIAAWTVLGLVGKFGFTAKLSGKLKKPMRIGVEIVGRGVTTRVTSRIVEVAVRLQQQQDGAVVDAFVGDFTFAVVDRQTAESMLGQTLPEGWAKLAR